MHALAFASFKRLGHFESSSVCRSLFKSLVYIIIYIIIVRLHCRHLCCIAFKLQWCERQPELQSGGTVFLAEALAGTSASSFYGCRRSRIPGSAHRALLRVSARMLRAERLKSQDPSGFTSPREKGAARTQAAATYLEYKGNQFLGDLGAIIANAFY